MTNLQETRGSVRRLTLFVSMCAKAKAHGGHCSLNRHSYKGCLTSLSNKLMTPPTPRGPSTWAHLSRSFENPRLARRYWLRGGIARTCLRSDPIQGSEPWKELLKRPRSSDKMLPWHAGHVCLCPNRASINDTHVACMFLLGDCFGRDVWGLMFLMLGGAGSPSNQNQNAHSNSSCVDVLDWQPSARSRTQPSARNFETRQRCNFCNAHLAHPKT